MLAELPPKTEVVRWVELTGEQRDMYESLRLIFDRKLRQVLATRGVGQSQIMILDALLKLRQVCCDPRLVKLFPQHLLWLRRPSICRRARLATRPLRPSWAC